MGCDRWVRTSKPVGNEATPSCYLLLVNFLTPFSVRSRLAAAPWCGFVLQVSEVYKLHRETYHLAQDYFDRFMATQRNVFKSTLQLIGITCLFVAAKVEVSWLDVKWSQTGCSSWVRFRMIVLRCSLCFRFSQEMYPPKVHQFAYVTDEACTEDEILSMEIIIMKVKWSKLVNC